MNDILLNTIGTGLEHVKKHSVPVYTFALYYDHESPAVAVCIDTEGDYLWMALFGKEQSAVGAFLLVFSLGLGYVPFIIVITLWSAVRPGRRG